MIERNLSGSDSKWDTVPLNILNEGQIPWIEILHAVTNISKEDVYLNWREQILLKFSFDFKIPALCIVPVSESNIKIY
jgi:hypothetical protein